MQVEEITIDAAIKADMEWRDTLLMPVGDVQLGSGATDVDRFKRHIEWGMRHKAYFLGMGDYVDVASPSNRTALRTARLYDSVHDALERSAAQDVQSFLDLVEGTEGRWLGLLQGHHYYEFTDGSTSDTRIAQALHAPFLGTCAFVRMRFSRPSSSSTMTCTVWCHHGQGGGIKTGAPLNKLENLVPYFDADIYLIGHMSKAPAAVIDQLYLPRTGKPVIKHKSKVLAGTGGFMQGYRQGHKVGGRTQGTYVEQAMLTPVSLGGIVITIKPVHNNGTDRLDMNVSI